MTTTIHRTQGLLKWPGGKAAILDQILPLLQVNQAQVYVEPFVGSGVVAREVARWAPVLPIRVHDTNQALIHAHNAAVRRTGPLVKALGRIGAPVTPERYAEVRREFNAVRRGKAPNEIKVAAHLLWLNRACFNGLYRENGRGDFNVPKGSLDEVNLRKLEEHLETFAAGLSRNDYVATTERYQDVLPRVKAGSTVYLDPPYMPDPSAHPAFTAYSPEGGDWQSLAALRALARAGAEAAARGSRIVMSNALHPVTLMVMAEAGWTLAWEGQVRRRIGGRGARRADAAEGLWTCGGL